MTTSEIDRIFAYQQLTDHQRDLCRTLFSVARYFAETINRTCPESREKSLALTALQQTLLWCDAAIAIHDLSKHPEEEM